MASDSDVAPAANDSSSTLRRSSRVRNRSTAALHVPSDLSSSSTDDAYTGPTRLEQIPYSNPEDLGVEPECVRIVIHPIAAFVLNFHAHLTRLEVIGYLGGETRVRADGRVEVVVLGAFPTKAVDETELGETGRSGLMEVEMDPMSSVEVMGKIERKGMKVVGWYHSHPDKMFSVEPSRVDIENQANYQNLLFRDSLFVAAICAPYNKELPDENSDLEFFRVMSEEIPVRIVWEIEGEGEPWELDEVKEVCSGLVSEYKTTTRRVRLAGRWRKGKSCAEKLRTALRQLVDCNVEGKEEEDNAIEQGTDNDVNPVGDAIECTNGVTNGSEIVEEHQNGVNKSKETEVSNGVDEDVQRSQEQLFHICVDEVVDFALGEYLHVQEEEKRERMEKKKAKQRNGRIKRSRRK